MATPQKISTCFHFVGDLEDAVNTYVGLFPNSKITSIQRHGEGGPLPAGEPMLISFELSGVPFRAINGVAEWVFTEAISLMVHCDDQAEIDHLWDGLCADGGSPMACGWLKDRFGVCWQIVPSRFESLLEEGDAASNTRVMNALYQMVKLDIAGLEAAAKGG